MVEEGVMVKERRGVVGERGRVVENEDDRLLVVRIAD